MIEPMVLGREARIPMVMIKTDAVADPLFGDLLANPHEKHGTCGHGEHDDHVKEPWEAKKLEVHQFGNNDAWSARIELNSVFGKESCLEKREADSKKTDPFSHLATALVRAFLDLSLKRRNKSHEKLHDDGSGDVRHDAKRNDGHVCKSTAGKNVHELEEVLASASGVVEHPNG